MNYHSLKKQRYVSKIVLLGDDNVGKTSLCLKFIKNIFRNNVESTIGVNFYTKTLEYHGNEYKLVIWDTSGHERFRIILRNYYKLADLYILMFDLSNKETFESLPYWLNQIEINNPVEKNKIIVLGNKSDKDIVVSKDLMKNFSNKYNLPIIEISTKEGINLFKMEMLIYKNIEVIVNDENIENTKKSNNSNKNEKKMILKKRNIMNVLPYVIYYNLISMLIYMDFKKKYLKYKNKYLKLKGGNTLLIDQEHVGSWSGSCKCPNGETYKVGDKHNGCRSIACENGISSGCTRNDKSGSRKKMICSLNDVPTNLVVKNDKDAGGWSGTCKCPDGESYKVGDKHTGCRALACEGGVSSGCDRNDTSGKYTKVICSSVNQHVKYWKNKIDDHQIDWIENKIVSNQGLFGLENLNIKDLDKLENSRLYEVLTTYIKKGLCGAKDGIQFPGNVQEAWKYKIRELCVKVHKEYRNLAKKDEISDSVNDILIRLTRGGRIRDGAHRNRARSFNFGGTNNRNGNRGNYPNTNQNGSDYFIPKEIMFLRKMLDMDAINWIHNPFSKDDLRTAVYNKDLPLDQKIQFFLTRDYYIFFIIMKVMKLNILKILKTI